MDALALLRASARTLLRRPGYALLVTATLALGIGGATAIFSLVHGVLLRPLPYADPDRIVTLDVRDAGTGHDISLSIPNYLDWQARNRAFDRFGAAAGWGFVRETPQGAERVNAQVVLGDFFGTLGLVAELGRLIPPEETGLGAPPVAVLGHGFWEHAFGGEPGALGSSLVLDGLAYDVVGVLPAGTGYPRPDVEVYLPMGYLETANPGSLPWDTRGSSFGARAVARLAEGATPASAQEDMDRVTAEVDALEGKPNVRAVVRPLAELLVGDVERGLWLLMGAVVLVLLIAGANVANLALARGEARGTELAVRRTLGAGSAEVARLLAAESLWLSLAGGAGGLALAIAVSDVLPRVLPLQIPPLMASGLGVRGPVLAFGLILTALSGALFALLPGLRAARAGSSWRHGARATGGRESRRLRDGLVVAQVALSLMLLVGSGLLLRSLGNLASVDKGFREEGVLAARLAQPRGAFASREEWLAFYDALGERLDASPEVERTAFSLLAPLSDRSWERRVVPEGVPFDPGAAPSVLYNVVSEDYFEVMGMRVLRGRGFTARDAVDAPLSVVIDATMAERFWPGVDPVGQRLTLMEPLGDDDDPDAPDEVAWRTVVGVVPNLRHYELASPSRVQAYVPMRQALRTSGTSLTVLAKASGDGAAVPGLVRRTVAGLRPDIPFAQTRWLADYVADQLGSNRALGVTTSVFGTVAALLAALGIFGVLTLAVSRRAPEIGIRLAVGATPAGVVRMVLGQGLALAALGAGLGLFGAALGSRALGAFLYDVRPWDPWVYGASAVLLALVAGGAALGPALRASRTHPVRVLRQE
ncbi:MAG TPA: ABC transporter permease [Longimicrobiales bacterium]|nr:ABC transporter permease [Longimicrobiales bacterium]